MSDLISRQAVKEWLERWEGYLDKDMIARMQLKVADIPTHKTPSNTLGALDCIDRHKAINIRFSEGFDHDGILYVPWKDVVAHLKELPSVKPEPEPVGCSGCKHERFRHERFGHRVCDFCSRFYADRYDAERRTDE